MKILLNLDVDYTHFNLNDEIPCWIGSKKFWQELYQGIVNIAKEQEIEIIFVIISQKPKPDFCISWMVEAFKNFFEKHNPHMYLSENNKKFFLTNTKGKIHYEFLSVFDLKFIASKVIPTQAYSSVYCIGNNNLKSNTIKEIAKFHQVPLNQCILIDDDPTVLKEVAAQGIHTVSTSCFHGYLVESALLEDKEYVMNHLIEIKKNLYSKVNEVIEQIKINLSTTVTSKNYFIKLNLNSLKNKTKTPLSQSQKMSDEDFDKIYQQAIVKVKLT